MKVDGGMLKFKLFLFFLIPINAGEEHVFSLVKINKSSYGSWLSVHGTLSSANHPRTPWLKMQRKPQHYTVNNTIAAWVAESDRLNGKVFTTRLARSKSPKIYIILALHIL